MSTTSTIRADYRPDDPVTMQIVRLQDRVLDVIKSGELFNGPL